MKKLVVTSIIAALTGIPGIQPDARAGGDGAIAAIGGFIGGVIVGSAIHHDRGHHPAPPAYCPPPVRHGGAVVDYGRHAPGHWEWVSVRVWVPGSWSFHDDSCGRRYRTYIPGRYVVRSEKRWIPHRGGYAYGYGSRR